MQKSFFIFFICICTILALTSRPSLKLVQAQGTVSGLEGKIILFATANGESSPFNREGVGASRFASLLSQAGATIQELNWGLPIPQDADLVVLSGPQQDYSGLQIARLWVYLSNGGNLLLFSEPPGANSTRALPTQSSLLELLRSDIGIVLYDAVLVDPVGDTPPIQGEEADAQGTPYPTPTAIPAEGAVLEIKNLAALDTKSSILQGVDIGRLVFTSVRPLDTEAFTVSATVTPLLYSSDEVYSETDVARVFSNQIYLFDAEKDSPNGIYLIAALSEGTETGSRVAVIGDGETARNGWGFFTSPPGSDAFVFQDVVQLVINITYWLVNETAPELDFTTAQPTATPTIIPTVTPTATIAP